MRRSNYYTSAEVGRRFDPGQRHNVRTIHRSTVCHRQYYSPCRATAGFTLIELLLALLMFALIAGAIFASFAAITDGVDKGRQSGEVYRVARGAIQRLIQELGGSFQLQVQCLEDAPSYVCEPLRGENGELDGRGRDRLMFLTIPYRHFPDNMPGNEICNVCYYIAENTRREPALFRYEDCTLGKKEVDRCAGKLEPLELTDIVVGLDVTYYDAEAEAHDIWPSRDAPSGETQAILPCRVHVALTLRRAQGTEQVFTTTVVLPRGKCEEQTQSESTPVEPPAASPRR
jgi:prepilin-type N-terminal cleavage/methylation domain-containing protein